MKKSVFAAFSAAMLLAACSPAAQEPSADEAMMEEGAVENEAMDQQADAGTVVEGDAEMEAGVRVVQEEEVE